MFARFVAVGAVLAAGVLPLGAQERQVPDSAAEVQLSFAPVVKRVAPAVVNVYATRMVNSPQFPDLFSQLFGRELFNNGLRPPRQRTQQSLGSGVIVTADGLIVTNLHVVEQADEVKVALSDKREFPADIIVKNERSDLAILRIVGEPGKLPTLPFADIDTVAVGDLVLAIGDPFGVGQSVTSGIVSAFASVPGGPAEDQYFIQTDAAINPGNSGGALVDMQGRLIGINRMIVAPSGGSNGIGFAIPSNVVRAVVLAAEQGGEAKRPWLGAQLQEMTPDLAAAMGMDRPAGVLVSEVDADGPAAKARLRTNDLIVALDDHEVADFAALGFRLATSEIGSTAKVTFVRDNKRYFTNLALEAAPETPPRDTREIAGESPFSGLTVMNLSPAVAEEMSVAGGAKGVIISGIADGSIAARIGFRRGDVLVAVNEVAIDTTRRLEDVAGSTPRLWDVTVKRGGETLRQQFRG